MSAAEPQAILSPITEAAIFLTLTVDPGGEDARRALLSDLNGLRRSVGFRIPDGGLTCVAGIGAAAWDRLFGLPRPAGLHAFREVTGPRHRAPATHGDLFLHVRAHRFDLCFELARLLTRRLDGRGRVIDEVHGFRSFDQRDLLGFVDGTENPEGSAARSAVLIGEEDATFAGGTYFVGYTRDPEVLEEMLENMFVGKPVGNSDRILDFSTPVTGSLFFVPAAAFLDDPPSPEAV